MSAQRRQLQRWLTQLEREHERSEAIYQARKAIIEAYLAKLVAQEAQIQATREALKEVMRERAGLRRSARSH